MSNNVLEVAAQKTEAIVLTRKWAFSEPKLRINNHDIEIQKTIKYLGVTLDQRMTFTPHVRMIMKSAAKAARSIGRLATKHSGPSNKRRLQ